MEKEEDILKAKERLKGGEDFAAVAADCSVCPSSKKGGSLGRLCREGMAPSLAEACWHPTTKIGEVVGPIRTRHGLHLLRLESREEEDAPGAADGTASENVH